MVLVGIMTVLEDSQGQVVMLSLYNQLGQASGLQAQSLAHSMFPPGTRLEIAEPCLKVMTDGRWAVRVDSPSDIGVSRSESVSNDDVLKRGKVEESCGRLANAQKAYLEVLSHDDFNLVSTLLANRAQAALSAKQFGQALADAAAAPDAQCAGICECVHAVASQWRELVCSIVVEQGSCPTW